MANKITFIIFSLCLIFTDASYSQVKIESNKNHSLKSICCDFGEGTPLNEAIDVIILEKFAITDTSKFRSFISFGNIFKNIKIYNTNQAKNKLGINCNKGLLKLDLKEEYFIDFQTLQPIFEKKKIRL